MEKLDSQTPDFKQRWGETMKWRQRLRICMRRSPYSWRWPCRRAWLICCPSRSCQWQEPRRSSLKWRVIKCIDNNWLTVLSSFYSIYNGFIMNDNVCICRVLNLQCHTSLRNILSSISWHDICMAAIRITKFKTTLDILNLNVPERPTSASASGYRSFKWAFYLFVFKTTSITAINVP